MDGTSLDVPSMVVPAVLLCHHQQRGLTMHIFRGMPRGIAQLWVACGGLVVRGCDGLSRQGHATHVQAW